MADLKLDTPRAERLRWTGRAVLIAGLAVVTLPSSQARGPDKSLLEAVQHYKRGIKSYEKGKVKEALPEFQEAVARANDQAYWHVMLSIALRKDGQDGPATEQCRVASQLAPDDEVLKASCEDIPARGSFFRAEKGLSAPEPLYRPEPPYSADARHSNYFSALVKIALPIDARGRVGAIRILQPAGFGLDESVIHTLRTWKFRAALRDGVPVPATLLMEFYMHLY